MKYLSFSITKSTPTPNSPKSLRPVCLVRAQETEEDVIKSIISQTDKDREFLNDTGFVVHFTHQGNEKAIDMAVNIQDTMKDLKLKRTHSGLGGGTMHTM